jgi:hypothetical protein
LRISNRFTEAGSVDVLALFLIETSFEKQVRHTHDSRERRADFVVQAGEEGPLKLL